MQSPLPLLLVSVEVSAATVDFLPTTLKIYINRSIRTDKEIQQAFWRGYE